MNLFGFVPQPNLRAEPKCSAIAQANDSPVEGFAILWRGKGENPYPFKPDPDNPDHEQLSPNQMYMCATCEFNKDIYEQYINNSSKK